MNEKATRFYYEVKDENKIYYLDETTGEFGSCFTNKKDSNYKYFHSFKGDDQSKEGLLTFKEKFNHWNDELIKCGKKFKCDINYKKYFNHYSATELIFQMFSANCKKLKDNTFENVNYDEYCFNEKCFNGGLIYLNPKYQDKVINSFGYDYSSFYPNILVGRDLRIPTKQGDKIKLESLDFKNLQYGVYKVNITCDNKEFRKIFGFSKDQTYTHFSLQFANKYKDIFNVKIELVTDIDFNAIVYNKENLVWSQDIFKKWFDVLYTKIKPITKKNTSPGEIFPQGNMLLKRLLSSLWGSLTKCEKYYFNDEEMENDDEANEYKILKEKYYNNEGVMTTRYECIKKSKPYKYHYGRMKPFLLSLGRNAVGDLIMNSGNIENVVRINTDGIVLNTPFDFSSLNIPYYPLPEDKTTGLIKWNNVNNYNPQ